MNKNNCGLISSGIMIERFGDVLAGSFAVKVSKLGKMSPFGPIRCLEKIYTRIDDGQKIDL